MTDRHPMTNEKLSERVEKAGEGSRELDAEIAAELFLPWDYAADWGSRGHDKPTAYPYTTSLDAAMTLAPTKPYPDLRPGEWWWMMEVRKYEVRAFIAYENHDAGIPEFEAIAATPALALCAAALRARGL